ncbi:MAG TPA: voltage-gated potassium channel protein [Candidatus Acidoferrum sp.]|nr:voltage-gated potassium channel protein [Candidatus Acidoferrum sp.]
MNDKGVVHWLWRPGRFGRFLLTARRGGQVVRARYWFPHIPLAAALAGAGYLLVSLVYALQKHVLLSDFPHHIFDLKPASMPYVLIGVAMLVMSVGLLFRSRFAWIVAVVLTTSMVLSTAILGHGHRSGLISYDGILLVALLLSYARFDRTSLAAGTLFALTSALLLLIYATFGSLYLGNQFSPPIKDLVTSLYYSVVTMSTVGYGDITPKTVNARFFAISVMVLGLAVFATSVTAIAGPMIARLSKPKEKRMKRTNHFIVIGATPLAYNTYREFKKRNQPVVLVMPQAPTSGDIDPEDLIVGDANSLETLRRAGADQAQAVVAMRADDSDNAFIVLAVKELKGKARTVIAINDSKHMERIKLVQPDIVIAPEVLGGEMLAMVLSGEEITTDFVLQRFFRGVRT